MDIIRKLRARGLLQDISDEDGLRKLPKGTSFYIGFDPTAPSLQIGNLVALIVAIHLGQAGFQPIILFGGATGMIGDPSGRSSERQLLDLDTANQNLERQKAQTRQILGRAGVEVKFVNNLDWTKDVTLLQFLRDVGKHFTVNYMIAKEVVKARLEGDGISYTEFSYMLLQSFDYLHLYQNMNCRLQIGGSDQWGNITAGLELIRRKIQGDAYALSFPLILDSQGRKFGKSEGGAIWLDPSMASPYRLHQYLLNVEDSQVIKYLRIFTFLEDEEIAALEAKFNTNAAAREAQRALADSVCTLVHGEESTRDAARCAEVLFGGSMQGLSEKQLEEIFRDAPSSELSRDKFASSTYLDLLTDSGLVKSRGDGKKLIASGGAYLNNERVADGSLILANAPLLFSSMLLLRSGKKNYHLLKIKG